MKFSCTHEQAKCCFDAPGRLPENAHANAPSETDGGNLGQGWSGEDGERFAYGAGKRTANSGPTTTPVDHAPAGFQTGQVQIQEVKKVAPAVSNSIADATPATTTTKEMSPGISLYTTKYQNQQGKVVGMCYEVQSDTALEFTLSIDGSRNLQLTDGSMKCTTQMPANTRTKVGEVEMVDKTTVSYSLKVGFSMRQISVCADPTSASAGPSQLTTTAGPAGSDNTTASSAAAAITAATSIPAATVEPGNGNAGTGTGHRKLRLVPKQKRSSLQSIPRPIV